MIEDINNDAIEVNLENLILPGRLYRIVENDPAAEKRKQSFLERWGIFNINTNTSGSQQANGIADPVAKDEETVELCSIEDLQAITLPASLLHLQDYSNIFSLDVWNNILDEDDRKKLEGYLPRIDDCDSQDIIKNLFEENSIQQFSIDPIKQFTKNLRGGVYNIEVYGYKKFIESMLDQLHALKIKRLRLNLLQKSLSNGTPTEYMTEITHDLYQEQTHDKPIKKKERSSGVFQKLIDDPKKSRKRKEREQTSSDDENTRESKRQKLAESKKKDTSRSQIKKSHPPPPPIKPFSFFSSVYELFNFNNREASSDLVTSYIDENPKVVSLVPIQYSTTDFVEMALKFLEDPPDLRASTSGKTATFNSFVEYDDESGTWRWLATEEAVPYFDQLEQVFFFAVTRGQVDYAKNEVRLQLHSKQTNTILPEDLNPEEYRRQERERYKNPDKPFTYRTQGNAYTVAPLKETGKAREHTILKSDRHVLYTEFTEQFSDLYFQEIPTEINFSFFRPSQVTILSLVRDAAARLPGGLGTKQDVVTLFRQSQYLIDNAAESQVHSAVRGALDRLQAEADPPVRYDADLKLWLYLHRSRSEQDWLDIAAGKFGTPVTITTIIS